MIPIAPVRRFFLLASYTVTGNFAVGNFAVGDFAVGNFAVRKFYRKEISP